MLERIVRWFVIIAMACFLLPGCSYMTANGRREMAYARYVKKYSHNKAKRVAKYKKVKMPKYDQPSDYKLSSQINDSPQSVTTAGDGSNP